MLNTWRLPHSIAADQGIPLFMVENNTNATSTEFAVFSTRSSAKAGKLGGGTKYQTTISPTTITALYDEFQTSSNQQ